MNHVNRFEEVVSAWPGVSVHPHRFGGREFRIGNAEVGHVHTGGIVDIPFPRLVRDALLEKGLAEQHKLSSALCRIGKRHPREQRYKASTSALG